MRPVLRPIWGVLHPVGGTRGSGMTGFAKFPFGPSLTLRELSLLSPVLFAISGQSLTIFFVIDSDILFLIAIQSLRNLIFTVFGKREIQHSYYKNRCNRQPLMFSLTQYERVGQWILLRLPHGWLMELCHQ